MTIELKALRFFAQHGWLEDEAIIGNEFEVTIIALFPAKENITALYDTIDYTVLYAIAKNSFSQTEQLLETAAQNMANAIEDVFKTIQQLQITITKLAPPIATCIGTVGITYTKDFR